MRKCKTAILISVVLMAIIALSGCASQGREFKTLDDLNREDVKLGLLLATEADFFAQEKLHNTKKMYMNSPADGTTAVLSGTVDAFSFDRANLNAYVRENSKLKVLDLSLGPSKIRLGIALGEDELKAKANQFIEEYMEDGTAEDMKKRWIDEGDYNMPDIPAPENPIGTLKVCTEAMCEPFSFVGDNSELLGYDMEFVTRFAYWMNMDVQITNMKWDALLPTLQSGKAQILAAEIAAPPEEVLGLELSNPYMYSDNALLVKSDETGSLLAGTKTKFTKTFITEHRWKLLVRGFGVTLLITVLSFVLGNLWGGVLCFMARSGRRAFRRFARAYDIVMQGLPPVVLLFIMFYVIFAGMNVSAFTVAIVSFMLLEGDSLSGIFRVGLDSVSVGQIEGGMSLGFRQWPLFRQIVLPQAAQTSLPLYGADFVNLIKGTSIVGFISIMDLTRASDIIRSRTYEAFFPMIATGLIYFVIIWIIIKLFRLLEKRFEPKLRTNVLGGIDKSNVTDIVPADTGCTEISDETIIRVTGLCKSYGDLVVLKDLDATIKKGEVVSVIGPSGCGKSTFIRCLNRIENADCGQVLINGEDIYGEKADVAEIRKNMGMVFQSYNLFEHMTNIENIMLGPVELNGMSKQQAYETGIKYLAKVGLAAKADAYPDELSGGQKQRVAIARSLAMEPEIMLFDEPTSALDPNMISEVLAVINELAGMGKTMIIVTHEMNFARNVSDRVFYMDEKRIYETGTAEEIFDNPKGKKTRDFVYKIRSFNTNIPGKTFDLYQLQNEIQKFLTKRVLTRKRINVVQLLCEEILYYRILNRIDEPVDINIEYSEREDVITICFRAKGIKSDFMNELAVTGDATGTSDSIISKYAADIQCKDGQIQIKA